jgi:hypothetical protein
MMVLTYIRAWCSLMITKIMVFTYIVTETEVLTYDN